ncbi:MAG TPA: zinc-dependent metalloprotease [Flavipsychrobacter sp.]
MFKRGCITIFVLLLLPVIVSGQSIANTLSVDINRKLSNGTVFKPVQFFSITDDILHANVLAKETILSAYTDRVLSVYETKPPHISLPVANSEGHIITLLLQRSRPTAYDYNAGIIDTKGRHKIDITTGLHYQGCIAGIEKSLATLSISGDGTVMVMYSNDAGNFVIAKLAEGSGKYILYNDKDFLSRPALGCMKLQEDSNPYGSQEKTTAGNLCRKLSMYLECDYDLYVNKGNNIATVQNYIAGLFNQVQALYRNENIGIELKSLYVWTVPDKYQGLTDLQTLLNFKGDWNNRNDTFDGDIAHFVSMDAGTNNGMAYKDRLCNRAEAYGYHDILGSYQSVPTYSFDVLSISHEIGHSIGSEHTHWCGWNTGAAGVCGSIDNCDMQEHGSSCSSCSTLNDTATGSWQGTIMSYCHLVSRGTNFSNGFGSLPGSLIRNKINSAGCLKSVISATVTVVPICKKDGAVLIDFDTNSIGPNNLSTPPYTFSWSNGAGRQSITNLAIPGTYTVGISDANGCAAGYSGVLTRNTADTCDPISVTVVEQQIAYLHIYPNPATQSATLAFYAQNSGKAVLKMTDVTGKVINNRSIEYASGRNAISVDLQDVAKGVYFVMLDAEGENSKATKLIVQ